MTRKECESKIAEHMEAIIEIVHQYSPDCRYLSAGYIEQDGNKSYHFNNESFEATSTVAPIDFYKRLNRQ